jgi:hypothetical protein
MGDILKQSQTVYSKKSKKRYNGLNENYIEVEKESLYKNNLNLNQNVNEESKNVHPLK